MKVAIVGDDGSVSMYGNAVIGGYEWSSDRMSIELECAKEQDGYFGQTFAGKRAKNHLIDFFDLRAVKKAERIAQSAIRKGDLIRLVDHSTPLPGERDYKTIEYVATADGDGGYQFNAGEKFYLIDRPKVELPTAPGSVVRVRLKDGRGVRKITLGNDEHWRGQDINAGADRLKLNAEILEVIA